MIFLKQIVYLALGSMCSGFSYCHAQSNTPDFQQSISEMVRTKKWNELRALAADQIKLNKNNSIAWTALGISLSELGANADSISAFEKAFSLSPELASHVVNLAVAYTKSNHTKKLISFLNQIQSSERSLAALIADRDDVFNGINTNSMPGVPNTRRALAEFPKLGPYPSKNSEVTPNADSLWSGIVVCEAFISPDGTIRSINQVAGDFPKISIEDSHLEQIKFPPLERGNDQVQRIKLIYAFDLGRCPEISIIHFCIKRLALGFSISDIKNWTPERIVH